MPNALPMPGSQLIDLLVDAVCLVDREGRFVSVSAACERIFGYTPDELFGRRMIELVHPDDRERTLAAASEVMGGRPKQHFENRYLRKDGRVVHIMWSARWSEAEQLRIAVARDISERKRSEATQQALYAISEAAHAADDLGSLCALIHRIVAGLLPADDFYVTLCDPIRDGLSVAYPAAPADDAGSAQHIEQVSAALVRGARHVPADLAANDDPAPAPHWLGEPLHSDSGVIGALALRRDDPAQHYTEHDRELLRSLLQPVARAIERHRSQADLKHRALYDPLTDLPNRDLLHDRLRSALARARREQRPLSLLFVDLDDFKRVNDSLGHASGDRLLQAVAERLLQCVREGDTVARLSGDEFVLLLEGNASAEQAAACAERVRSALRVPIGVRGETIEIHPSIGIARFPEHGDTEQQLLQRADEAMYRAKRSGGNGHAFAIGAASA